MRIVACCWDTASTPNGMGGHARGTGATTLCYFYLAVSDRYPCARTSLEPSGQNIVFQFSLFRGHPIGIPLMPNSVARILDHRFTNMFWQGNVFIIGYTFEMNIQLNILLQRSMVCLLEDLCPLCGSRSKVRIIETAGGSTDHMMGSSNSPIILPRAQIPPLCSAQCLVWSTRTSPPVFLHGKCETFLSKFGVADYSLLVRVILSRIGSVVSCLFVG
jgi:hypothetical protein